MAPFGMPWIPMPNHGTSSLRNWALIKRYTGDELAKMVGWEGKKVWNAIMPDYDEEKQQESIYAKVNEVRKVLLPQNGGILYDGVKDGLQELAGKYQLFIVSNCAKGIIRLFMDWAGINDHIIDEIAYGTNYMPKHHNIQMLINRHKLKARYMWVILKAMASKAAWREFPLYL